MAKKKIWVLHCSNESGDRWVDGYFVDKPTEGEIHAHFKKTSCEYDLDGRCYLYWDLVELKPLKKLPPLPKAEWSEGF